MIVSPKRADRILDQMKTWKYAVHDASAIMFESENHRCHYLGFSGIDYAPVHIKIRGIDYPVMASVLEMLREEDNCSYVPRLITQHPLQRKPKPIMRISCDRPEDIAKAEDITRNMNGVEEYIHSCENRQLEVLVGIVPTRGTWQAADILFLRHPDEDGFAHINVDRFVDLKNFFLVDQREIKS